MRHSCAFGRWLFVALALVFISPPQMALANGFKVLGTLTRDARLQPGQKAVERIMVKNTSKELVEVEAKQSDYFFNSEGANRYDDVGTLPRSNGAWIEVSPQQLRIPPGETLAFHYTMEVPLDSDLLGSYWSMILISALPKDAPIADPKKERAVAVSATLRYGIQMITEVGTEGKGSIKVTKASLTQGAPGAEGSPAPIALEMSLENDGTRHVRPELWLEVYSDEGAPLGKFPGEAKRIYPGCSTKISVDLSALPRGHYNALMLADLGRDEVIGARYDLQIP